MRVSAGRRFLLEAPCTWITRASGRCTISPARAPHPAAPVRLLEEHEVVLGHRPDLRRAPRGARPDRRRARLRRRSAPGARSASTGSATGAIVSSTAFGTISLRRFGKLWIEFCLLPSGSRSCGPTTPTDRVRVEVAHAALEGVREDDRVVVEQRTVAARRAPKARVVAGGEADVARERDQLGPREARAHGVDGAVGRRLVDDDGLGLEAPWARAPAQLALDRGEAVLEELAPVPVDDDDAEIGHAAPRDAERRRAPAAPSARERRRDDALGRDPRRGSGGRSGSRAGSRADTRRPRSATVTRSRFRAVFSRLVGPMSTTRGHAERDRDVTRAGVVAERRRARAARRPSAPPRPRRPVRSTGGVHARRATRGGEGPLGGRPDQDDARAGLGERVGRRARSARPATASRGRSSRPARAPRTARPRVAPASAKARAASSSSAASRRARAAYPAPGSRPPRRGRARGARGAGAARRDRRGRPRASSPPGVAASAARRARSRRRGARPRARMSSADENESGRQSPRSKRRARSASPSRSGARPPLAGGAQRQALVEPGRAGEERELARRGAGARSGRPGSRPAAPGSPGVAMMTSPVQFGPRTRISLGFLIGCGRRR